MAAKIEIVENIRDLGEIAGDTTQVTYVFYSRGAVPLIVDKVTPSCGCTVAQWTSTPIAIGDSGIVVLRYIPKPEEKGMRITKSATLDTNAGQARVQFQGMVK